MKTNIGIPDAIRRIERAQWAITWGFGMLAIALTMLIVCLVFTTAKAHARISALEKANATLLQSLPESE